MMDQKCPITARIYFLFGCAFHPWYYAAQQMETNIFSRDGSIAFRCSRYHPTIHRGHSLTPYFTGFAFEKLFSMSKVVFGAQGS